MKNTRHERITLVVAAYIIGFTTAFIAFGVNQIGGGESTNVISYNSVNTAEKVTTRPDSVASIRVEKDGLVVVAEGLQRLLSARKSAFSASVISSSPAPGFAERLVEAELSRNNKFVYFCEQLDMESETCDPYVYSLENDTVYSVTLNGEKYFPAIGGHSSAWSPVGYLSINEYTSASPDTPWILK